jgi:hypothetical protein
MINLCPYCGQDLPIVLNSGLSQCDNCQQVFDSSDINQLLSAAWLIRKKSFTIDQLRWHTKLEEDMLILVNTYVAEHSYSHQDFQKFLKKIGVANKSYLKYDE